LVDGSIMAVASDNALVFGVLSSSVHTKWAVMAGGKMGVGNDPRYQAGVCFDPFPFPDLPEGSLKQRIRDLGERLDTHRKRQQEQHPDLTLTGLYNVLEKLRAGDALNAKEKTLHDQGLVTLLRQIHDELDAAVLEAYGWTDLAAAIPPADILARGGPDAEALEQAILTRLVALNKERAAEEAKGLIRWLRPEFQAPDYAAPVTQTLDLGEAAAVLPDNVIPWPGTLPEQVSAVQSILSAAGSPLAPQDVARAFKGKRAVTVRPVLDALAGIGMARRLGDGRYAA
jgi:hypothetical protein